MRERAHLLPHLGATRRAGLALGGALPRDALVLFFGPMGSGKTTLIKSVCEAVGIVPAHVISPTYTLVNVYPGAVSVYHVDFFRLERPEALLELDRDDWVNPAGITLIEWPEAALPLLAGEPRLDVRLDAVEGRPPARRIALAAVGSAAGRYGGALAALDALNLPPAP
ncbi:MAG: tRNA (adenosine(37)-N6)-threonylcarbamoyltransferase complex ATPase subunit type 1 TsaE [Candidatus Lambdaproteobacteria bacterium]|nr:tRNA (adenosine(37)-N6)-threonylcarbamoyltransferase complex ATPase subunit type 1 TsaE [Candidatus Lambdaproteobacteria bacterium]